MASNKTFSSEEARLAKNEQIAKSWAATRAKREQQDCRVYTLKLTLAKATRRQREALERVFLEAKWMRNSALAADDTLTYDWRSKTASVKVVTGVLEERELKHLGSQVRQSILEGLRRDMRSLAALKKRGKTIGKLKFAKQVNSIELKQHGTTYRIRGQKVSIQGLPGYYRIRGLDQLKDKDLANAKLIHKAGEYYLAVTTFQDKILEDKPEAMLGIDFGLKTHVTTSSGLEVNVLVQETERMRRLLRKLRRQISGSKNYTKTRLLIQREYGRLDQRKADQANKLVALLTSESIVCFQDDALSGWKTRRGFVRGGKTIQHSILGRVKAKLSGSANAIKLPRFLPTTKLCVCGVKNEALTLVDRVFECASCGYSRSRDLHAAENMIRFALISGQELPVAPVEGLSDWNKEAFELSYQQASMKQETDEAKKPENSRAPRGEASVSSAQM